MAKVVALLAVVLLASCSGKKTEKDKDAGAGGGHGTTSGTKPPPPPKDRMLTCDEVITKDFRAKYLADATMKDMKIPTPMAVSCEFSFPEDTHPKSIGVDIGVHCLDSIKAAMTESFGVVKKQWPDFKDVAGIGAGAIMRVVPGVRAANGATMVIAFDDDSNCKADLSVSSEIDATAITKDLLATLPPK